MKKKKYKLTITPLTALHIGTGDEFGPMDYVVASPKNSNSKWYFRFSADIIAKSLSGDDLSLFYEAIEKDDIITLRSIFRKHMAKSNSGLYRMPAENAIAEMYKAKKHDKNNQLLIKGTYRSAFTHKAVIPGSSIKGAIRTALLNLYAKSNSGNKGYLKHWEIEPNLLNYDPKKIHQDPFRNMRISDGRVKGSKAEIVLKVSNYRPGKHPDLIDKMQINIEAIRGELLGGDAQIECEMDLVANDFALDNIIKACDSYYMGEDDPEKLSGGFNYELIHYYSSGCSISVPAADISNSLQALLIGDDVTLIRLGRFSQVENMILRDFQKGKKGGKSRMVAHYKGSFFPMGWAVVRFEPR